MAFLSKARRERLGNNYLLGAPELVIEIPSPSNTRAEMRFGSGQLTVDEIFFAAAAE